MSKLQLLLRARQSTASANDFAAQIGIPLPTLYALYNGDRGAGVVTLRKISAAFPNDNEMRSAIAAYVLGDNEPITQVA